MQYQWQCFALRFLVYSFTTNPWYVLFVEPGHMLCYAVFLSAYVDHVKSISPDNVLNTMYGIANSLWLGFGFIAGNVFDGYFYDRYGGRMLYLLQAGVALIMVYCYYNLQFVFVFVYQKKYWQ